ncbi:diacylglycerol kinase family protein [Thermostilla marina]
MAIEQLPPEADQIVVLINPKAGWRSREKRRKAFLSVLEKSRFHVTVSSDLSEAADLANRAFEKGTLRTIVGIGGDGTAAELVNRTVPGVPFTLLPAGTANLVSRHFRLPKSPTKALEMIRQGRVCRFDAGSANGRLFLAVASCGFDAEAVYRVHQRRQQRNGRYAGYFSYVGPVLKLIASYPYPEIRIEFESREEGDSAPKSKQAVGRWAFVFNIPQYAWGLPLTPKAIGTDGLLDLCTLAKGGLVHGLRYVAFAQFAQHVHLSDCTLTAARRFRITSEHDLAYQLDGDPGGRLPLEIEIVPDRARLIIPSNSPAAEARD